MLTFPATIEGINELLRLADESNDPVVLYLKPRQSEEGPDTYITRLNQNRIELLNLFNHAVRDPLNGQPRMVLFFDYDGLEELRNRPLLLANLSRIYWHNLCLD